MFDLAIKSNNVVTPQEAGPAIVLIREGVISAIAGISENDFGCEILDLGDKVLLPGIIDPHVHINEPGRTDWEGFNTATLAAIAGGITTVVDMPLNSSPVTTTSTAFDEKLLAAKNQLHAHCGFWGGIIPGNEKEIEGLVEKGVLGFKTFLTHSGIDEFPNTTEADLHTAMPLIAKYNLPLLVHCELLSGGNIPAGDDARSYQDYLHSRPARWEDSAIALMIRLSETYNCHVHIVHLSSAAAIDQIRKAKERGVKVTVETAPHYLYFNAESIGDGETMFKCAPPIRELANNGLLWEALVEGVIDFVATDHSPAPPALKFLQTGDFRKAWGGIASLQLALPVLWTITRNKRLSLNHLARWLCENPAILTGMHTRKGKIAIGYDADLLVLDPGRKFLVTEQMIHHKHRLTPYLGHELYGVVEQTFLNGVRVFDNGEFARRNYGKIITRQ